MKKSTFGFYSILFLLSVRSVMAQQPHELDSLYQVLRTCGKDTNRVNTQNILSKKLLLNGDYEKAKQLANDAIFLAEKLTFPKGKANALNNLGILHWYQGNYREALRYQQESLQIHSAIGNNQGVASCYNGIGIIYDEQGDYSAALKNYFAALRIFEETEDQHSIASALANIAIVYYEQHNYPDALTNQMAALKIFRQINESRSIASAYENIGNIYADQGNPEEALKSYSASLELRKEMGNRHGIANSYVNIGAIYEEQGNALYSGKEKEASKSKYAEALESYRSGLKIFQEIGEQSNVAQCYTHIGSIMVRQGRYAEARQYLADALSMAKETGNKYEIKNAYLGLAAIDSTTADYRRSLENYKSYVVYKDSLLNAANSMQITEMKTRYETEKKDHEIAMLSKDKEIQNSEIRKQTLLKNSLVAVLALALVLFFLVYNNYRTRQKLKLENIRNNIAADLHDDIGSTLNSISLFSEVAKKEAGHPIPALDQIGMSARKIIDGMSDIVWTINPENDTFENVITRMRSLAYLLLKAKGIEFVFKADEGLNHLSLPMQVRKNIFLLFKEALNNLVKYSQATRVSFHLSRANNQVKLVIRDNGVGFDTGQSTMGNGLKNMNRRASEIGGRLRIETTVGNGTTVELDFKA